MKRWLDWLKYWGEVLIVLGVLVAAALDVYSYVVPLFEDQQPRAGVLFAVSVALICVTMVLVALVAVLRRKAERLTRRANELGRKLAVARADALRIEDARLGFLSALDGDFTQMWEVETALADASLTREIKVSTLRRWLEDVLSGACKLVRPDDQRRACIFRVTVDQHLTMWISVGMQQDSYDRNVFDVSQPPLPDTKYGAAAWCYYSGTAKRMDDWRKDPHYRPLRDKPPPYEGCLMVPVLGSDADTVGVLCIDKATKDAFTDVDESLAGVYARLVTRAIAAHLRLTGYAAWDGQPL